MRFRFVFQRCALLWMLIVVSSTHAAAVGAPPVLGPVSEFSDPLAPTWALGDLDGDGHTDLLVSRELGQTVTGYLYRVALKLSDSAGSRSFTFENADVLGVNIGAVDVDGDHDLDLVVSRRFSLQTIGVWLNDGKGSFTKSSSTLYSLPAPAPFVGSSYLDIPTQLINENSSRRSHARIWYAGFVRPATVPVRAESAVSLDCHSRLRDDSLRPRAPPSLP
jgi:hypothetical protein